MAISLPTRADLFRAFVRRMVALQEVVTDFSNVSIISAIGRAVAAVTELAVLEAAQVRRDASLLSAAEDALDNLMAEHGTARQAAARAKVLVVLRPTKATVQTITVGTGPGGGDELTVDDVGDLEVGMSVRIRSEDGLTTEAADILSITALVIEVSTLTNTYAPTTEDVKILARVEVAAGTALATTSGVALSTLAAVVTGEANPILDGMSTSVALADKVWAEADVAGTAGNIDPGDVTNLSTPVAGIQVVFNPAPATGGTDEESDAEARRRTIYLGSAANQLTGAWLEATCAAGDTDALRTLKTDAASGLNIIPLIVVSRAGGALSSTAKDNLVAYLEQRARFGVTFDIADIVPTEISIVATITLERGYALRDVWVAASSGLADYLDLRTWVWGQSVDATALYDLVRSVAGVAGLDPADFSPGSDVTVADDSLPILVYVELIDATTGETVGGDLAQEY